MLLLNLSRQFFSLNLFTVENVKHITDNKIKEHLDKMFLPIKKDCLKSYHDFYKTLSLNVVSV